MTDTPVLSATTGTGTPGLGTCVLLVVVGTDHHRFDSLMSWIGGWTAARRQEPGSAGLEVIVQHGSSAPPAGTRAHRLLGHDELQRLMATAGLVVCHGGPATIMEARRHGHLPVVVPRNPERGEHVDGHQMRFARRLATHDYVVLCEDEPSLHAALDAWHEGRTDYSLRQDSSIDGLGDTAAAVERVGQVIDDLVAERAARRSLVRTVHHALTRDRASRTRKK